MSSFESKKVYRQSAEPTISDIVVACEELLSKVEGTCKQVDSYFNSCCWETGDLLPGNVRSRIETESQNVKFTSWEKFNRALPWHQESDEEKRKVAVIEEHQQIIKKYVEQFHETRNRTLTVIQEYQDIHHKIMELVDTWTRIVDGYVEKDFPDCTEIKKITKSVREVSIPNISGLIADSEHICFWRGAIDFGGENGYIEEYCSTKDGLISRSDLRGILDVNTATNIKESFEKSLRESIATLNQSARLFSPALPDNLKYTQNVRKM
jgi:hypothetical protein